MAENPTEQKIKKREKERIKKLHARFTSIEIYIQSHFHNWKTLLQCFNDERSWLIGKNHWNLQWITHAELIKRQKDVDWLIHLHISVQLQ